MPAQKTTKYHIFFKSATEAIIGMRLLYTIGSVFDHGTQEITFASENEYEVAKMYMDRQSIGYESFETESHRVV
jgi:hypothetical protein